MKLKLITGMFKMDICDVSVSDDTLIISTAEQERRIPLTGIENISVTRHADRNSRLEISLASEIIEGVFVKKSDADEFTNSLKGCMGSELQIRFHGQ